MIEKLIGFSTSKVKKVVFFARFHHFVDWRPILYGEDGVWAVVCVTLDAAFLAKTFFVGE